MGQDMSQSHKTIISPTLKKCEYNKTKENFAFIQVDYQTIKTKFLELPSLLQMNQRSKQNGIQCFLFT